MKTAKNIFAPAEGAANDKYNKVAMKEFISMSSDTNLTFCAYQHKNLLVVAGNKKMVWPFISFCVGMIGVDILEPMFVSEFAAKLSTYK